MSAVDVRERIEEEWRQQRAEDLSRFPGQPPAPTRTRPALSLAELDALWDELERLES